MRKSDVYKFYREKGLAGPNGGVIKQIAEDLDVSAAYVSKWPDLLPKGMAAQLHIKHGAELPFDPNEYK